MDWKSVVGTVAPWIGTALGGPLGGMAVDAIGSALGLSERTEETIKRAISGATPEQMLALKRADQEFQARMQELGFQERDSLVRHDTEDRNSARHMQETVKSIAPPVLAAVVTFGFFAVLAYMMFCEYFSCDSTPESPALLMMLGSLGTAWGAVANFYFGSNHAERGSVKTPKMR